MTAARTAGQKTAATGRGPGGRVIGRPASAPPSSAEARSRLSTSADEGRRGRRRSSRPDSAASPPVRAGAPALRTVWSNADDVDGPDGEGERADGPEDDRRRRRTTPGACRRSTGRAGRSPPRGAAGSWRARMGVGGAVGGAWAAARRRRGSAGGGALGGERVGARGRCGGDRPLEGSGRRRPARRTPVGHAVAPGQRPGGRQQLPEPRRPPRCRPTAPPRPARRRGSGSGPARTAASAAAPAGSTTCFSRSSANRIPARIVASSSRTMSVDMAPGHRERPRPGERRAQAVGHARRLDRDHLAALRAPGLTAFEPLGLDAVDARRRPAGLDGRGDARDEPAAADADDDDVDIGQVVDQLEPGATVAGDDRRVVERMDERQALGVADPAPSRRRSRRHARRGARPGRRSRGTPRPWSGRRRPA